MAKNSTKVKVLLSVAVAAAALSPFLYKNLNAYCKRRKTGYILEKNITSAAGKFSGEYSIYLEGVNKAGFSYSYKTISKFPAASLIKVPIMAAVFYAIDEGKFSMNDEFVLGKKDITPGSGVLKYNKIPFKITLRKLIEFMVAKSDNTAANKIIGALGFNYINNFFLKAGLKDTLLKRRMMDFSSRRKGMENYTSCEDMAYILRKIYRNELIGKNYSQKMVSLLKKQEVNDRIPRYLPEKITVAHKTGLERNVVSDTGLIFSECCDYILCVITSDFRDYKEAKDFIAKVSLVVYNTLQTFCVYK